MSRAIRWTYQHWMNSTTYTDITKIGVYQRKVKHTVRYQGPQLAMVHFEGNKRPSKVPYIELIFTDKGAKNE